MRSFPLLIASAIAVAAAVAVLRGQVGATEAAASASAALAPEAPRHPDEVVTIRIVGPGLPVAALERALATRVGAQLRADHLERDRRALVATLVARGYLAARVTDVRLVRAGGVHLVFDVDAGGLYRVDEVRVTGRAARRFAELARVPTLLGGQPWQPERAADNVELLREWLARRGVRAEVTIRRSVDHVRHAVDVTFAVR